MLNLTSFFKPLTAQPDPLNENSGFVQPCDALKPFVSGYWGTEDVITDIPSDESLLVIPDARMDIIFDINHTKG